MFLLRFLSKTLLKFSSWKVLGGLDKSKKLLVVVAPHTSNWDAVILFLVKYAFNYKAIGLGKMELFQIPVLSQLLKKLGIIPVDRANKANLVYTLVKHIKNSPQAFALCLAPEGSRFWRKKWRSGFYYIALKAKVELVCVSLDYPSKTIEFSKEFLVSGNIEEDFKFIKSFYAKKKGKHPQFQGPIEI